MFVLRDNKDLTQLRLYTKSLTWNLIEIGQDAGAWIYLYFISPRTCRINIMFKSQPINILVPWQQQYIDV